jgi:hypothetical protein
MCVGCLRRAVEATDGVEPSVARVPAGIASAASSPQRKRSGVGDVPSAGWEKRTIDKKEREPLRWDLAVQEKVTVGRSNLNLGPVRLEQILYFCMFYRSNLNFIFRSNLNFIFRSNLNFIFRSSLCLVVSHFFIDIQPVLCIMLWEWEKMI